MGAGQVAPGRSSPPTPPPTSQKGVCAWAGLARGWGWGGEPGPRADGRAWALCGRGCGRSSRRGRLLAPESTRKLVSSGFGSSRPPGLSAYKPQLRCSPALRPICATRPGELCPPNSGGSPRSLFLPGFPGPAPEPSEGIWKRLGAKQPQAPGASGAEGRLEEDERPGPPKPSPAPGLWVRGGAPPGWRQSERPTQDPCRPETGARVWGCPVLCPTGPTGRRGGRPRASPDYGAIADRAALLGGAGRVPAADD